MSQPDANAVSGCNLDRYENRVLRTGGPEREPAPRPRGDPGSRRFDGGAGGSNAPEFDIGKPVCERAVEATLEALARYLSIWPAEVQCRGGSRRCRSGSTRSAIRNAGICVGMPLVTIDGETARDFDDAVFAETSGVMAGGWWLPSPMSRTMFEAGTALDDTAWEPGHVGVPARPGGAHVARGRCRITCARCVRWRRGLSWFARCEVDRAGEVAGYRFRRGRDPLPGAHDLCAGRRLSGRRRPAGGDGRRTLDPGSRRAVPGAPAGAGTARRPRLRHAGKRARARKRHRDSHHPGAPQRRAPPDRGSHDPRQCLCRTLSGTSPNARALYRVHAPPEPEKAAQLAAAFASPVACSWSPEDRSPTALQDALRAIGERSDQVAFRDAGAARHAAG